MVKGNFVSVQVLLEMYSPSTSLLVVQRRPLSSVLRLVVTGTAVRDTSAYCKSLLLTV